MTGIAASPATFSAAEVTDAYAAFHAGVADFVATGDWTGYADLFTPDAVCVEHALGTFAGRDEIREWSVRTMTSYPGRVMTGFPIAWQVVDPLRSHTKALRWARIAAEHGKADEDVLVWLDKYGDQR